MIRMLYLFQVVPEVTVSVGALSELVKTNPNCWRTFCAMVYIRTVRMIRDPYKLYVMILMPISELITMPPYFWIMIMTTFNH